eukprot:744-Heterococcus_DN1.PRE.3
MALQPQLPDTPPEDRSLGSRASRRRKGLQKGKKTAAPAAAEKKPVVLLKRSSAWACIQGCGACCYLQPSERPDLEVQQYIGNCVTYCFTAAEWLPEESLALYKSMVADDGWCKHYDKTNRACTIYEDRPYFCKV